MEKLKLKVAEALKNIYYILFFIRMRKVELKVVKGSNVMHWGDCDEGNLLD